MQLTKQEVKKVAVKMNGGKATMCIQYPSVRPIFFFFFFFVKYNGKLSHCFLRIN